MEQTNGNQKAETGHDLLGRLPWLARLPTAQELKQLKFESSWNPAAKKQLDDWTMSGNINIYWFTGQPGSGKSTLADALARCLRARGRAVARLDGDELRECFFNKDYSREGRARNVTGAQRLAKLLVRDGLTVVCSFVSPERELRELFKREMEPFMLEIYAHTRADRGLERFFAPNYEPPLANFLDIDTTNQGINQCLYRILQHE